MVEPIARVTCVHRYPIKATGVAHIRLVTIPALLRAVTTIHPRHHLATVTAATRSEALGIDVALLQHEIGCGLDIGVFLVAEGAGIGFQEFVSPTERAVIIHTHHHVALRGKHLIVPALMEVVAPI